MVTGTSEFYELWLPKLQIGAQIIFDEILNKDSLGTNLSKPGFSLRNDSCHLL